MEQGGVGPALRDGGAVEPLEVVTDEDVVRAQPAEELAVCSLAPRALLAFPEQFFALSAGGQCVEDAIPAELDVEE